MRTRTLVSAAAVIAAVTALPAVAGAATITGTVKGGKGMRVAAIGLDGTATTARLNGKGRFTLRVPNARARNSTLHLLTASGDYFGPIVLGRSKATGYVRTTTRTTGLGTISRKSGFALASGLARGRDYTTAGSVRVNARTGKPLGAGKLGLVRTASSPREMARETQGGGGQGGSGGQGGNPNDPCGGGVGGDCDRDGVPNSIDTDDNGNLTIDFTDAVSVQTTAKLLTYSSVGTTIDGTLNFNTGATRDSINAWLGSTSTTRPTGLQVAFYYQERTITGQDPSPTLDDVWVTCESSAPWCAPGTSQATVSGFSEFPQILPSVPQFGSVNWSTYTGSTCTSRGSACQAQPTTYPAFGFTKSPQSGGGTPSNVWTAFVKPNSPDTLGQVNADSVINLNYRTSAGGPVSTKPIGISPYFVTTPAITQVSANGATRNLTYPYPADGPGTNSSNGFDLGTSGTLGLTLNPPQRLGLPGEAEPFYTVGGLAYGLTLDSIRSLASGGNGGEQRPSTEAGCSLTPVSGLAPRPASGDPQDLWPVIAPLVDTTAVDQPASAPRTVAFTADVKGCIAKYIPGASTSNVSANVSLQAVGQPLQNGANRSSISFSVRLP